MIKYSLHQNTLSQDVENYRAVVHSNGTLDLERVVKTMVERGAVATEADAGAVLKGFFSTLESLLLYGFRVSTPIATFGLSMHGLFENQLDTFDPNRHEIDLVITPTRQACRSIQRQAQVQKQTPNTRQPRLLQYVNPNNGDGNQTLTPGGGAQLMGEFLSFDQNDPDQGIFLTAGDQKSIRIEVIMRNTPSDLIFLVPSGLAAGEYRLEVWARFGTELRTGVLKQPLIVA
ncbi:MAG: DUF4469 domain-containing protein [Anaerolineae bacterium]|nr:DUF4469 domain-containing protein [Anaerolineae bacterium]